MRMCSVSTLLCCLSKDLVVRSKNSDLVLESYGTLICFECVGLAEFGC